ncbi:succinate dehydrogenase cytochrome b subunit [Haliangium ochraceum]|uniref:Succinate dehydrogenase (Or fumarate reductase) cytochrome b subunit, b558 family n=1 Tax=Haliangium ochraceum (strain DSM 14365 / JCM 11303 / SMP-2) TaxID=502025 RepID=D0LIK0_HALO1|nr:succinate dehydrogenase cytochrome b subunit [Haliangium ochraceum]ACY18356.1 succinate dehydrogenase (or fumarate reductase) cytochrome b subunit, b558 family [Haliangium ochraceum DSM 14365]
MSWVSSYVKSSVGSKHLMAITGIILSGFVLGHMAGNLLAFLGPDAYNSYAHALKENAPLLWGTRITLFFAVIVHVVAALRLTAINKAARPVAYKRYEPRRTPFYARVMPMTGLILLAFIVYHLLHYTLGVVQVEGFAGNNLDELGRPDVYGMLIHGFSNYLVGASYLVAMAILCMHLAHGVSSLFQSIGFNHPKYNAFVRNVGPVYALIIFVGNCSLVLGVWAGIIAL